MKATLKSLGVLLAALAVVYLVGWWLAPEAVAPASVSASATVWTCSMHPQIRSPRPGKCPICGMDLIPAGESGASQPGIVLSEGARRVARVETVEARRALAEATLRTVGRFETDERLVSKLTAWLPGRIERVQAPYVGARVESGDAMVDLTAPELLSIREELRAALRADAQAKSSGAADDLAAGIAAAVRERLRRSGLSDAQIDELASDAWTGSRITLRAPIGGVVMERPAQPGMYVREGDTIAQIAVLDPLVLWVDVFERDLGLVSTGRRVEIEVDALPGVRLEGVVESLRPSVTAETRTVRARVTVPNPGGHARPEMFARATIRIPIGADGRPLPAGAAASAPESSPATGPESRGLPLLVPASAVLDLGSRRVVYVEKALGRYEVADVTLGPRVGDAFVVLSGVSDGDRVVSRGGFLVDSQTQIEGKPSLLFPCGASSAPSSGHAGHGAGR